VEDQPEAGYVVALVDYLSARPPGLVDYVSATKIKW
jgi:hypothetical protein